MLIKTNSTFQLGMKNRHCSLCLNWKVRNDLRTKRIERRRIGFQHTNPTHFEFQLESAMEFDEGLEIGW